MSYFEEKCDGYVILHANSKLTNPEYLVFKINQTMYTSAYSYSSIITKEDSKVLFKPKYENWCKDLTNDPKTLNDLLKKNKNIFKTFTPLNCVNFANSPCGFGDVLLRAVINMPRDNKCLSTDIKTFEKMTEKYIPSLFGQIHIENGEDVLLKQSILHMFELIDKTVTQIKEYTTNELLELSQNLIYIRKYISANIGYRNDYYTYFYTECGLTRALIAGKDHFIFMCKCAKYKDDPLINLLIKKLKNRLVSKQSEIELKKLVSEINPSSIKHLCVHNFLFEPLKKEYKVNKKKMYFELKKRLGEFPIFEELIKILLGAIPYKTSLLCHTVVDYDEDLFYTTIINYEKENEELSKKK